MADRLVAVDDSNYLLPTPVRNAYLADVQNRITTAVGNIPNVAQEVANRLANVTSDGQVAPLLNTATATRNAIDNRYYWAPAPSGGDDTQVLQQLLTVAANTNGVLMLRAGTYKANLETPAAYTQPWIVGTSRNMTTIQAVTAAKPVVKFRGLSGSLAGGGLRSVRLMPATTGGGNALVFSGCGGVKAEDVDIEQVGSAYFDNGVVFANEFGSDFTEFCTFQGSIWNCKTLVSYYNPNNVESFHGSGLVGATVLNPLSSSTFPMIWIRGSALPYNAPMSCTSFLGSMNTNASWMQYENPAAGRAASFYGNLRFEGAVGAYKPLVVSTAARVFHMGTVSHLGSGDTRLGSMYLVDKVTYEGASIKAQYKPVTVQYQLKTTPTVALGGILRPGEIGMVSVRIVAANYDYAYLFSVYQSPYNPGGTVFGVQNLSAVDTTGQSVGAPTFTWGDYGLYIANSKYTTAFIAGATLTPMGGWTDSSTLNQYLAV